MAYNFRSHVHQHFISFWVSFSWSLKIKITDKLELMNWTLQLKSELEEIDNMGINIENETFGINKYEMAKSRSN